jgi:hypothetical protein
VTTDCGSLVVNEDMLLSSSLLFATVVVGGVNGNSVVVAILSKIKIGWLN